VCMNCMCMLIKSSLIGLINNEVVSTFSSPLMKILDNIVEKLGHELQFLYILL
jgi:hypothetical protein